MLQLGGIAEDSWRGEAARSYILGLVHGLKNLCLLFSFLTYTCFVLISFPWTSLFLLRLGISIELIFPLILNGWAARSYILGLDRSLKNLYLKCKYSILPCLYLILFLNPDMNICCLDFYQKYNNNFSLVPLQFCCHNTYLFKMRTDIH